MDPARLKIIQKTIYWQEMNTAAQACIARAEKMGMSMTELAHRCDLAHSTVGNLYHRLTGYPQWMTLWKLAQGVNCRLELVNRSPAQAKLVQRSFNDLRRAFGRKPRKKMGVSQGKRRKQKAKEKAREGN